MKRIVFKISGEALKEENDIISILKLTEIANNIKKIYDNNIEIIIVVGAGNIWRGRNNSSMNPVNADNVGMIATSINSIILYDKLKEMNLPVTIYNSFLIDGIIETYNVNKCKEDLQNKKIVIIGGGSRLPLCTTDFACIQRAIELEADTCLFGKSIDGVYDKDPNKYDAVRYDEITRMDVLKNHLNSSDELGVMDITAEALLTKYNINVLVFKVDEDNIIDKIINNEKVGTKIV